MASLRLLVPTYTTLCQERKWGSLDHALAALTQNESSRAFRVLVYTNGAYFSRSNPGPASMNISAYSDFPLGHGNHVVTGFYEYQT